MNNVSAVTGCSPKVQLVGDLPTAPFPQVLSTMFTGDTTEIGPPSVGVRFFDIHTFQVGIQGPNNSLIFTMYFDKTSGGVIISPGNTDGILAIGFSGPQGIGVDILPIVCDIPGRSLEKPRVTRVLVLKTIPGFIRQGDVYYINVYFIDIRVFINVLIARSKSPLFTA